MPTSRQNLTRGPADPNARAQNPDGSRIYTPAELEQLKAQQALEPSGGYMTRNEANVSGALKPIAAFRGAGTKEAQRLAQEGRYRPTYYGGSENNADIYRNRYAGQQTVGQTNVGQGLSLTDAAAMSTMAGTGRVQEGLQGLTASQDAEAAAAGQGFNRQVGNADMSRAMVLGQGRKLEDMANAASSDYMKTDQNAFQAQQDQATRGALSIGAAGGASGVRAALAGSQDANAAAAQQAQMVRANEYNALLGNRQQAVGQAAGIYSGVGAQDQQLAQLQSQRQLQATGQQASLLGAQGNLTLGTGAQVANAGAARTQAGLTTQGQYLGAETSANTAAASIESQGEAARSASAQKAYKDKYGGIMTFLGG